MTYKIIFETGAESHGHYLALVTAKNPRIAVDKFIRFLNNHEEYSVWRHIMHNFYPVGGSFRYVNMSNPWARIDVATLGEGFVLPEEVVMIDNSFLVEM